MQLPVGGEAWGTERVSVAMFFEGMASIGRVDAKDFSFIFGARISARPVRLTLPSQFATHAPRALNGVRSNQMPAFCQR
jgi:hypothetical protein